MRLFGRTQPTRLIENPPDTVVNLVLAGGTAQAQDFPSGTLFMRVAGLSSSNTPLHFYINMSTTAAALPASGASTASTLRQLSVVGERYFQVYTGTTGFSVYAQTSGYFVAECWK